MIDVVQAVANNFASNLGFSLVVSAWHAGYYMVPQSAIAQYMEAALINISARR